MTATGWGSRLRAWLLDRLVPPAPIEVRGGPAFFAYSSQKSVLVDGFYVCPLIDGLIAQETRGAYTNVVIGHVPGPERNPSSQLPRKLNWAEFMFSLLFYERGDLTDYRFLASIYTRKLCFPHRHTHIWRLRNFLIARYFALKFRNIAAICDSAYVVVYYNAIMLGVVRAFRRLGKPVWEVQHGHVGPVHDAYSNASAFALESFFRPSAFLVWERKFGEYLEATLGARWESTDYLHLKGFAPSSALPRERPTVLYTLTWDSAVPAEVVAAVRTFKEVRWLFRTHPHQPYDIPPPDDLESLRHLPNVTITSSSAPLGTALSECDLHMTYYSSAVHEAAAFGIPSLCLNKHCIQDFPQDADAGLVRVVPEEGLEEALSAFLSSWEAHPRRARQV